LTGFPKPETLKEISAHDFLLYISEELFNYPFWLQDLSHFPPFFRIRLVMDMVFEEEQLSV